MVSTWIEVDVTTEEFCHLFEQKDISDHRDTPRKVWVLLESDVTGIAIHIFPSNPTAELAVRPEREVGILTRMVTATVRRSHWLIEISNRLFLPQTAFFLYSKIGIWLSHWPVVTRMKTWFKNLLPGRLPSPVYVPFIPYQAAIIGVQIEIYQNTIKSVVWNPVPGEDDFEADPDAPPNPTVEVLIDDVDSYLPHEEQDSNPPDGNPKESDGDDELDRHPF